MRRIKRIAWGTARFGALNALLVAGFAFWLTRDAFVAVVFGMLIGSLESLVFLVSALLGWTQRRIAP